MKYQVQLPGLPLAVYREVAAHLRQVNGVEVELLPQVSREFNYEASQVGGLWIAYPERAEGGCRTKVEEILTYYGDRFGPWEVITDKLGGGEVSA